MISADEIIKLIKQGKSLQEISKLIDKNYYDLRIQGYSIQQTRELMNDLIYELSKRKLNETEIAVVMNMSKEVIKYRLRKTNEKKQKEQAERLQKRKDEDEKIYELREQGLTQAKIAEIMKLSISTIQNRLIIIYAKKGKEQPKIRQTKTKNDEIDNTILKWLAEGKTQKEIAKKLGVVYSTISYRIKKMEERGMEIPNVTKKKIKRPKKTKNDEIDNKILEGLAEGKTHTEIAKELGLAVVTISKRIKTMRERGIEISNITKKKIKRPKKTKNDEIDNKILEGLVAEKTQAEIAKELGITKEAISYRTKKMRERGIEIPNVLKRKSDERDNIILVGLAEGKTQEEIAKELGLTKTAIQYRIRKMKERGIEIPCIKKKRKVKPKKTINDEIDNKILEGLAEGKTQTEIARELGLTVAPVSLRIQEMRERGIEIPNDLKNEIIDNKIIEGLTQGKTLREIAKELGLGKTTISERIQKLRKRGIEIIPKSDELDELIYDSRVNGDTYEQITKKCKEEKGIIISRDATRYRYKKVKKSNQELAKAIINLIKTKHATIEQVKIMGEYYGVDVEAILNSLEIDER